MHRVSVLLEIYNDINQVQVANDNVYSALSFRGVLHVGHKATMLEISLKHMTFLLILVVHIFFPEYNTHYLSIYSYWIISYLSHDQSSYVHVFGIKDSFNSLSRMMYVLIIKVCMTIFELLVAAPVSFTVSINIVRNLFPAVFKPYIISFLCPVSPTP